jgi:TonB family protein
MRLGVARNLRGNASKTKPHVMSTKNEKSGIIDRRNLPRGVPSEAVLVLFGENNWGKLVNISEGGMGLEFAQTPSSDELMHFELASMGPEASRLGEDVHSNSIQANGQMKWSRQFERTAGVQFVGLVGDTREQIRRWLSIETPSGMVAEGHDVMPETTPTESFEPVVTHQERKSHPICDARREDSNLGESSLLELPTPVLDEQPRLEKPPRSPSRTNRISLVGLSSCLAILAVLAGTAVIWSQRARVAASSKSVRKPSAGDVASPYTGVLPATKSTRGFQVEVVDAADRRLLLSLSDEASASVAGNIPSAHGDVNAPVRSSGLLPAKQQAQAGTPNNAPSIEIPSPLDTSSFVAPSTSVLMTTSTLPAMENAMTKEPGTSARGQFVPELTLTTPNVTRTATNVSEASSSANSGVPSEVPVPLRDPRGETLAYATKPISDAPAKRIGGQIQQARLISSVPPAYPPLAKTERVEGSVTIDALIDPTGKVTNMRALSGSVLLQEAAKDALRLWRYEPARLNGEPTSTHLQVTVKFQSK